MTPDEFRTHGKALIDWVADYLETVDERRVTSTVQPGDVRSRLPEHPPAAAEPAFTTNRGAAVCCCWGCGQRTPSQPAHTSNTTPNQPAECTTCV